MSLQDFLVNKCDVVSITYTTSGGEQVKNRTTVYSDIDCSFEPKSVALNNEEEAQEVDINKAIIVVEPDKTDIKKGYEIVLKNAPLDNEGTYVVEYTQMVKTIWPSDDNIYIIAKKLGV